MDFTADVIVLFLDIDGVLNTTKDDDTDYINPLKAAMIEDVCLETGAVIILSSTWRDPEAWAREYGIDITVENAVARTRTALNHAGLTAPIVGWTPLDPLVEPKDALEWGMNWREHEIIAWLNEHPEIETFAIVDDVPMRNYRINLHSVHTNEGIGLLVQHAAKLKKILTPEPDEDE